MQRRLALVVALGSLMVGVWAAAGPYSDAVLADAPLAYWRLGDAGNPVVDSADGNPGTADAGVVFGQPRLVPTEGGDAAIRTVGTDRVVVPGFEKFPGGSTGYTVEYWIKVNSIPAGLGFNIVGDGESGGDFYLMNYFLSNGRIRPHFNGAGTTAIDSNAVLNFGQTYYVVTTWDQSSGDGRIYIDGVLDKHQNVGTGAPVNTNNPVFIGKDNREPGADLIIDAAAIYNRALSFAEVRTHAHAAGLDVLKKSVSLSTDVLGPGTFNDGYNNNTGASTVELVRFIPNSNNDPHLITYNQAGDTIDFAPYVLAGATADNLGSDVHGRGGNLWIPADGEANVPHAGLGAHANWLITYDIQDILGVHLIRDVWPLLFTGRVGVNGNVPPGTLPPGGVVQAGVWVDGQLVAISPLLSRTDPSYAFDLRIPRTAQWLTLALLNGNANTGWDDMAFRDVTLSLDIPEPGTLTLLGVGLIALMRRRRGRSVAKCS